MQLLVRLFVSRHPAGGRLPAAHKESRGALLLSHAGGCHEQAEGKSRLPRPQVTPGWSVSGPSAALRLGANQLSVTPDQGAGAPSAGATSYGLSVDRVDDASRLLDLRLSTTWSSFPSAAALAAAGQAADYLSPSYASDGDYAAHPNDDDARQVFGLSPCFNPWITRHAPPLPRASRPPPTPRTALLRRA